MFMNVDMRNHRNSYISDVWYTHTDQKHGDICSTRKHIYIYIYAYIYIYV